MLNLWERMAHIYGHKWSATFGESAAVGGELTEAAKTWQSGLYGITGDQLADGLRACISAGKEWPPTLPEFKNMCLGKSTEPNEYGLNYVPEVYRKPKHTEAARADAKRLTDEQRARSKRIAQEKMAKINEILSRPRKKRRWALIDGKVVEIPVDGK